MAVTTELVFDKETKRMYRFVEPGEGFSKETLYVRKERFGGKKPARIRCSMLLINEQGEVIEA